MSISPSKELEILDLGLSLYDGENRAGQVCPSCKGGSSGEGSFSISRDSNHVIFKCHRASCSFAGRIRTNGSAAREYKEHNRSYREFVTDPDPVSAETTSFLREKYLLSDEELRRSGFGWINKYGSAGRLWIPMRRRDGSVRGYTARDLTGTEPKKALNFKWRVEDSSLSWYNNRLSKKVILVEDAFSALRASTYLNAVNLSGTHVSEDDLDELLRSGFTEAYLALDKDAIGKAVKLSLVHRGRYRLRVVPLEKDLKNMTREALEEFMKELV